MVINGQKISKVHQKIEINYNLKENLLFFKILFSHLKLKLILNFKHSYWKKIQLLYNKHEIFLISILFSEYLMQTGEWIRLESQYANAKNSRNNTLNPINLSTQRKRAASATTNDQQRLNLTGTQIIKLSLFPTKKKGQSINTYFQY